jgi:hypothetical protein
MLRSFHRHPVLGVICEFSPYIFRTWPIFDVIEARKFIRLAKFVFLPNFSGNRDKNATEHCIFNEICWNQDSASHSAAGSYRNDGSFNFRLLMLNADHNYITTAFQVVTC